MSGPLADALATLEGILGPGAPARCLRRCEIDDAADLVLTLELPDGTRWFRTRGGRVIEIFPEDDESVPSAAALAARARAGRARILSWRPGRRIVARVDDELGSRIQKGHRSKRFRGALASHRAALERVDADAFTVPLLLETDPDQATLTFGILPGTPFEPGSATAADLTEIGRRISRLQQSRCDDLPPHGRKDEVALLERAGLRAEKALGSLPGGWRSSAARLEAWASRAPGRDVAAHRDLHDGQILVDGGRFGLLDFDLLARAERALDLANLAVHVELRLLESSRSAPSLPEVVATEALLEGAQARADPGFAEAFAYYRASTALRLALLCAVRPFLSSSVAPMLARARAALDEIERV
ncbi:MAG: phosphotransferase family protein [Planctomycetota bacterium]